MRSFRAWFRSVSLMGVVGLFAVVGCGESTTNVIVPPPQPGAAPQVTVQIPMGAAGLGSAGFGTDPLIVQQNTIVIWINGDTEDHTVTSVTGDFDSGVLRPGERFSHQFPHPGRFPFFCKIHGENSHFGEVDVEGGEPAASPSPTISPTSTPTSTPTPSPTVTILPTPTETPTATPTVTPTVEPSASPSPKATVTIERGASEKGKEAFGPNPFRVEVGTTVIWLNEDTVPHTVTSRDDAWKAEVIDPGKSFELQFDAPGVFPYYCELHPTMEGTLVVGNVELATPGPEASPSPGPSPSASPVS